MAALTAESTIRSRSGALNSFIVADTTVYSGGLAALAVSGNATTANIGKAVPFSNAVGIAYIGWTIGVGDSDTSHTGSSDTTPKLTTSIEPMILYGVTISGASSTSVGAFVYPVTDNPNDMTLTPASNHGAPCGLIVNHQTSTTVDVLMFGPEGMAGLYSAASMGLFSVPGQMSYTGTSAKEFITDYPAEGSGVLTGFDVIYQGASTMDGSDIKFIVDRNASAAASLTLSTGYSPGAVISTSSVLAGAAKFDRGDDITVRVVSAGASTSNGVFGASLRFAPVFGS